LGGFEKFKGQVKLADDNSVESISLDIDINSVWTQFDKLTAHLKNADFFETSKFGTAKFVSTKIEANEKGMKVTGNLTMHGTTKEISFPVKGNLDKSGVAMNSEFKLDRSLFGMDKMTSGVDKMVSVKFVVGQPTKTSKSMPGPGTTSQAESQGDAKLVQVKLSAPNMT
jgi:polyisoprenoid-binding protein YceI